MGGVLTKGHPHCDYLRREQPCFLLRRFLACVEFFFFAYRVLSLLGRAPHGTFCTTLRTPWHIILGERLATFVAVFQHWVYAGIPCVHCSLDYIASQEVCHVQSNRFGTCNSCTYTCACQL